MKILAWNETCRCLDEGLIFKGLLKSEHQVIIVAFFVTVDLLMSLEHNRLRRLIIIISSEGAGFWTQTLQVQVPVLVLEQVDYR